MNSMCKWFLLSITFSFLASKSVIAQSQDSLSAGKISHNIIPIAFYLPETGFALGGTGILTFRFKNEPLSSRPSQILYSAAYTFKNQLLFFIPFDIYKNEEDIRIKGELGYYRYFYNFYGIGPNSLLTDRETYDVNFPRFQAIVYKRIYGDNFFGVGYRFDNFDIVKLKENGILDQNEILGKSGGNISNFLISLLHDSRDHIFDTKKGFYFEATSEIGFSAIGADYSYQKYSVDMRYFIAISKRLTLASQVVVSTASGDAPFFVLPYVSTPQFARGYADRRFMDHAMTNLQSELRYPIYKRFSGVAFLSTSFFGSSISDVFDNSAKISGGMGIRYILNKKERTKIRLDIGITDESFNFYITANDAF